MGNKEHRFFIPDTRQRAWHLSVIQLTSAASLPTLLTSILMLEITNFQSNVLTLLIANILAFLIRLGMIAMSFNDRKSTLDVSRDYLGSLGSYFIAFLLMASTLAWYVTETNLARNALYYLLPLKKNTNINQFIQISVALGIISTFFCMEGMRVLRWLSMISFPIIAICFIAIFFFIPYSFSFEGPLTVSFIGLTLTLAAYLGMSIDLPTFFRHSKSWRDSLKALIITQILLFCISIGGLFFGQLFHDETGINTTNHLVLDNHFLRSFLIIFIIFTTVCANVYSVYTSSVGWEIIAPILAGRKEYLILGLGFTILYVLIADVVPIHSLLVFTEVALINLTYVLILGYLVYLFFRRPPTFFEQTTYFAAWLTPTILFHIPPFNTKVFHYLSPFISFFIVAIIILSSFLTRILYNVVKKSFKYSK